MGLVPQSPKRSKIGRLISMAFGLLRRGLDWCGTNPFQCWVWSVFVGFALAAWSVSLGNGGVYFDGKMANGFVVENIPTATGLLVKHISKEVGYLAAPNWTFYSVTILPVIIVCSTIIWSSMPRVLESLSTAGMIRLPNFKRVDSDTLLASWERRRKGMSILFFAITIVVMIFVMKDWWTVVARPILHPDILNGIKLNDSELEYDWSVSCLYKNSPVYCDQLLVFGFVAYVLIPGLGTALAFSTAICALFFVTFICGFSGNSGEWQLVATPLDHDKRGGFGRFARLFTALIILSISVVLGCILMIMQNAYLRDPLKNSILDMVTGDATAAFHSQHVEVGEAIHTGILEWLFRPTMILLQNPQTSFGVLITAFVVIAVLGVSWGLLRTTAKSAQERALEHASELASEYKLSKRTMADRLNHIDFWPVGWLKQNQLIFLMFCLVLGLVSYRMLLLPLALAGFLGIHLAWELIMKFAFGEKDEEGRRHRRRGG